VQTRLFEMLAAANEEKAVIGVKGRSTIAPVNLAALARSVTGLVRAETDNRRWAERTRAGVRAVEEKVEEAKEKGLSEEAAAQIKTILMEF